MAKQSFTAAERREQFLNAGIELARKVGIHRLSSAAVAAKCKVTGPMVFYAFGSTANMRNEIIKVAKKAGIPLDTPASVRQRKVAKVAVAMTTPAINVHGAVGGVNGDAKAFVLLW